jgi:uncharacterized membrane protein
MDKILSCLVLAAFLQSVAAESATLEGYVQDGNTGKSMHAVIVEVYKSEDHSRVVNNTLTDGKGFYSLSVAPGPFYDVYLRMGGGSHNQRTTEAVKADGVYKLNFNIVTESSYENTIVERYGLGLVVLVAILVLALIILDLAYSKRRSPSLADLKKEKEEIEKMVEISREKYHKREIDEETFKSISAGKQERLIEIESKIRDIEGKA